MAKLFISKRVIFKNKKEQEDFILSTQRKLDTRWKDLAKILEVNEKTLRQWKLGHNSIPLPSFEKIRNITNSQHKIKIIDLKDHLKKISSIGGRNNLKINKNIGGNKEYRIKKWREWWNITGKNRIPKSIRKKVKYPEKNLELSEFVGIMIGDGGVANYHISITLHSKDDRKYSVFVKKLIKKIFGINPKIYKKKNSKALDIIVHSKNLVDFCQQIGLKKGNKIKQGLDIPYWIKKNNKKTIACLRGLFDTDGSYYTHKYFSKNKSYKYNKISFSSASPLLMNTVRGSLKKNGICARIDKQQKNLLIESKESVDLFKKTIGSNNPKNRKKF